MADGADTQLYRDDAQRRADRAFVALGQESRAAMQCPRCMARDNAAPPEAQLRILVHEDWCADVGAFVPRAMNQKQAVASELLTMSLRRFIEAYGVSIAAPRIAAMLSVLRLQAKREMITARILKAREPINRRARAAWERGDTTAMREIEAEPTPDYPGKAQDDAWLREEAIPP